MNNYREHDEEYIKDIILSATDATALSEELHERASRWPFEVNLSRQRSALLRPLAIRRSDRVLEVGCGCGPLTRYLGEVCDHVTAIDSSSVRCDVARARVRDLDHVNILNVGISDLDTSQQRYDWIIIVGVMEYFTCGDNVDNVNRTLSCIGSLLDVGGRCAVGIENKLGLKYWAGYPEDHVSKAYYGLQGLYQRGEPRTYGRRELEDMLARAGMPHQMQFACWPDYQVPQLIYEMDSVADQGHGGLSNALFYVKSRSARGMPVVPFDERLLYSSLDRNAMLSDLTNSFLFVASAQALDRNKVLKHSRASLWYYSISTRKTPYACETMMCLDSDHKGQHEMGVERSVVEKRLLMERVPPPVEIKGVGGLSWQSAPCSYIHGALMTRLIYEASAKHSFDENVLMDILGPWAHEAVARARTQGQDDSESLSAWRCDGDMLEFIPANILVTEKSGYVAIDSEWLVDREIPLGWILYRGVANLDYHYSCSMNNMAVFNRVCSLLSLRYEPDDVLDYAANEIEFRRCVYNYRIPVLDYETSHRSFPQVYRRHPYG